MISNPSATMIAAVVPSSPSVPTYLTSSKTLVAFQWIAPVDNGGSPIIAYKISWSKQVNGIFTDYTDLV